MEVTGINCLVIKVSIGMWIWFWAVTQNISKSIVLGVQKVSHPSAKIYIFIDTLSSLLLFLPPFPSLPSGSPCSLSNLHPYIFNLFRILLPLLALMRLSSFLRTILPLYLLNTVLRLFIILPFLQRFISFEAYITWLKNHNHFLSLLPSSFHSWKSLVRGSVFLVFNSHHKCRPIQHLSLTVFRPLNSNKFQIYSNSINHSYGYIGLIM